MAAITQRQMGGQGDVRQMRRATLWHDAAAMLRKGAISHFIIAL